MGYWNEKDHSSYDIRLKNGGISTDLPRIDYGRVFDIPLGGASQGATHLRPTRASLPGTPQASGGLLRMLGQLAVAVVAIAVVCATTNPSGDGSEEQGNEK